MSDFTGEIKKTEWVIASPKFGKRRIWEDNNGFFFVVGNVPYRNCYGDDEIEVYKADTVHSSMPTAKKEKEQ